MLKGDAPGTFLFTKKSAKHIITLKIKTMALDKSNSGKPSLLSQWKKRKKPSAVKGIGPRPKDAALSLSYGQQRLWLLQQLYPDNPFYQYGHLYQIKGSLDVALLRQSFQHLLQRHELLRCRFVQKELGASVELIDSPDFIFEEKDMSQEAEAPQRARELALEFVLQAYDLSQGPLIKAQVLHLSEDEHHLVLGMHHIIGDRWSLEILQKELFAIYQSLRSGAAPPLSPLKIQYTDFAHWQKSQSIEQSHLDYWLQQLSGELPILQIPSDFKRPAKASFSGKTIHRLLSPTLSDRIRQMAKAHSSTPYAFLLAAFKVLLFRHSQQEDILVGSPFINRDKPELEGLIGFFNETLVLRSQLSNKQNFRELIQQVKETTLSAFAHKQVPFDRLVRELQPERHGSANPLFQAMFLYNKQGASLNPSDLPFQVREEMIDLGVSKFDLTLFATETDKGIELSLEFALDLWKSSSAERLLDQMEVILEAVCQHPDQAIGQIPLLVEKERKKLLEDWNATEWEMPAYANIHQLIEEMGGKHGDEWAVVDPQNKLSYAQLNQGANAIAAQLVALGLQKNEVIGLYARRSVDMIMGMVGILKAGAAYLPLDPEYPAERIEYMLTDSGARILLTQADLLEQVQFSQSQKVVIEEASQEPLPVDWQAPMVESDQLAYIIYTSGSTGKPKGVPIQHDNLLHS
ncbi:MAG: condensation domain-containing protein, partial [Bacteroidota bacterium]